MSIELIFNQVTDFRYAADSLEGSWLVVTDGKGDNHEGWGAVVDKGLELTDDNGEVRTIGWDDIQTVNV